MAIYHFHAGIVKRSDGHSSVSASAYYSGSFFVDERTGLKHNFSKKQGVVHSEILLPENAPRWMSDREKLWNSVEATEKRKDAQVARTIDVALPRELSIEQNIDLVREFVQQQFVDKSMVADFSVHNDNKENPHVHILLSLRRANLDGFDVKKAREWNSSNALTNWRKAWAETVNKHLLLNGHKATIDHRSLEVQGVKATPAIHMGKAYFALKYQGKILDRVRMNREIINNRQASSLAIEKIGFFSNKSYRSPYSELIPEKKTLAQPIKKAVPQENTQISVKKTMPKKNF